MAIVVNEELGSISEALENIEEKGAKRGVWGRSNYRADRNLVEYVHFTLLGLYWGLSPFTQRIATSLPWNDHKFYTSLNISKMNHERLCRVKRTSTKLKLRLQKTFQ